MYTCVMCSQTGRKIHVQVLVYFSQVPVVMATHLVIVNQSPCQPVATIICQHVATINLQKIIV